MIPYEDFKDINTKLNEITPKVKQVASGVN
jgi:hypothetical protein